MKLPKPPTTTWPVYRQSSFFHHEILHRSKRSRARVGRLHTPHGIVDTPGFVAVGTNGAIKGVTHAQANDAGMQLMFANALHLILHPGADVVEKGGGLHSYIGRSQPLITDSGGFQIFSFANRGQLAMPGVPSKPEERSLKSSRPAASLNKYSDPPPLDTYDDGGESVKGGAGSGDGGGPADEGASRGRSSSSSVKVTEEGATFRSYRDGSKLTLTPESSVEAQKAFGADIILPLDVLQGAGTERIPLAAAVERTHRWEGRSLLTHLADPRAQAMYGIVHGGTNERLRAYSIETLRPMPFDGYAIGGSLGRDRSEMLELLRFVMPQLPPERPSHLLGIGDEESIAAAVPFGVDTFDSCFPTR